MSTLDTGLHYPIDLARSPETWTADFVGAFCDVVQSGFACGQHSDSDIGVGHLRPMNVNREGRLDFGVVKFVSAEHDDRRLVADDVLFNNTNSPELIGKTAHVSSRGAEMAFSNHMTRLQFNAAVEPRFAAYQLHFLWMAKYFLHACVKHVNQASISTRDLAVSVPFVAPPLNEQRRIVAKIEELFSELDEGIESLKTAREQLKVYRQALLKHAFEGKLTAAWRAENPDKLESAEALLERIRTEREERYEQQLAEWQQAVRQWEANGSNGRKPLKPGKLKELPPLSGDDLAELPELPAGWGWLKLVDLSDLITKGASPNWQGVSYVDDPSQVLFVTSENVRENYLDLTKPKYLEEEFNRIQPNSVLQKGDVLINIVGASIGRAAVYTSSVRANINQAVALVRIPVVALQRYLGLFLNSHSARQFYEHSKVDVARANLSLVDVGSIRIPLPGAMEIETIADELETRSTLIEQQLESLEETLHRSEALRQSILKKAFSGQLVPQDPDDEPASVLLERIRIEKAATNNGRSRRKVGR